MAGGCRRAAPLVMRPHQRRAQPLNAAEHLAVVLAAADGLEDVGPGGTRRGCGAQWACGCGGVTRDGEEGGGAAWLAGLHTCGGSCVRGGAWAARIAPAEAEVLGEEEGRHHLGARAGAAASRLCSRTLQSCVLRVGLQARATPATQSRGHRLGAGVWAWGAGLPAGRLRCCRGGRGLLRPAQARLAAAPPPLPRRCPPPPRPPHQPASESAATRRRAPGSHAPAQRQGRRHRPDGFQAAKLRRSSHLQVRSHLLKCRVYAATGSAQVAHDSWVVSRDGRVAHAVDGRWRVLPAQEPSTFTSKTALRDS